MAKIKKNWEEAHLPIKDLDSNIQFCQTLSVNADPLDLFDQSLLLDMIFLSTPQLRGGVNIFFFYKVSFEKHPSAHCRVDCSELILVS